MKNPDERFIGSIPAIYDRFMVPIIFEPYALDLAQRVAKIEPKDVLEIAAGTGVLARALLAQLPPSIHIVATDLNQPMLDYAMARNSNDPRIEWKVADAMALPFEDQVFDVVACQFGVMFFPDQVRGYREARRVLKAGGCFLFSVWDRISENEFADVVTDALAKFFPDDPPRFMARTPHGYFNADFIREELSAVEFKDVSIDRIAYQSKAPSPRDAAVAFCQGTPLRNEIMARDPTRLEEATEWVSGALAQRFGTDAIEGRMSALVIAAAL